MMKMKLPMRGADVLVQLQIHHDLNVLFDASRKTS